MAARGDRVLLTPEQERIIRDAHAGGATQDDAAYLAGVSRRLLVTRLADQLADVRWGQGRGRKARADPSQEEIERLKALPSGFGPALAEVWAALAKRPVDDAAFTAKLLDWEKAWVASRRSYKAITPADPVAEARALMMETAR
jgi:hypothetical protein